MPFTPEQAEAVKAAVDRYLRACPICGSNRWQLNPDLTFLPLIEGKDINLGRGQPCVSAICSVCGSLQLFNALTLGLGDKLGVGKAESSG